MFKPIIKNILVVDSSQTSLVLMEGLLSECGYIIKTASSVNIARKIMKRWNPDLILLDILPDTNNSIEFIHQIPRKENKNTTSVIIISSIGHESMAAMTNFCGVSYLSKPVEPEILIRKVNEISTFY
ncbi:MAG: two-component system response regulator [Bacteroidales bacterium]